MNEVNQLLEFIDYDALRRQLRVLVLLDGSERAGISPIRLNRLHVYAYVSNVLAPVWQAEVFDGHVLKRRGGPFYPALQHELDRMVGLGLVNISNLGHFRDLDGQWRLDGSFFPKPPNGRPRIGSHCFVSARGDRALLLARGSLRIVCLD